MKKNEMIALLESCVRRSVADLQTFDKSAQRDNPQMKELVIKTLGELDAFSAVLFAMRGDTSDLRTFAEK